MDKFIATTFKVILAVGAVVVLYIVGSSLIYETGLFGSKKDVPVSFMMEESLEDKSVKSETPVMFDSLNFNDVESDKEMSFFDEADEEEKVEAKASKQQTAKSAAPKASEQPAPATTKKSTPPATSTRSTPVAEQPRSRSSSQTTATPTSTTSASGSSTSAANLRAKFESLKKRFNYGTDANGVGWYVHKVWDVPDLARNTLMCYVNDDGEMYLASHYIGDEPISHTMVKVQAGGQSLTTKAVNPSSSDFVDMNMNGKAIENVSYKKSKEKPIIDMINATSGMVNVQMMGDKNVDFQLNRYDKEAFNDCRELASMLSNYL